MQFGYRAIWIFYRALVFPTHRNRQEKNIFPVSDKSHHPLRVRCIHRQINGKYLNHLSTTSALAGLSMYFLGLWVFCRYLYGDREELLSSPLMESSVNIAVNLSSPFIRWRWWRYIVRMILLSIQIFSVLPFSFHKDWKEGGTEKGEEIIVSRSISRFFTALLSYPCANIYQNISGALVNIDWIRCLIFCPNSPV